MQGCGWDAVTARCKQLFGPKKKKILKNFSDKRLCAAPPIKNKKKKETPSLTENCSFLARNPPSSALSHLSLPLKYVSPPSLCRLHLQPFYDTDTS